MASLWLYLVASTLLIMNVNAAVNVSITLLQSAVEKGAVCLDGSPPSYYYFEGFGEGISRWIIYLEGGGWCKSENECYFRSLIYSGSSVAQRIEEMVFDGVLDDDCTINPEFCKWNKVYIHYCDGSSFLSNVEEVDPKNNLTFRGGRIFRATINEMLAKGLGGAQDAILAGSSAGGLATILHCDLFRSFLPNTDRVKCLSDSGFFIRGENLPAVQRRDVEFGHNVVATHRLANTLPTACTAKRNPDLCLFPEYLVEDIQTPLFLLESAYDSYQVSENLFKGIYHTNQWDPCYKDLSQCNATLATLIKDFGRTFIETLLSLDNRSSRGMFVHSCYRHTHIFASRDGWTCSGLVGNVLGFKTIGQALGDWYYDRGSFSKIDTYTKGPLNCTSPLNGSMFYQECRTSQHVHY